jgi:very-short-patch-repair endonuclease
MKPVRACRGIASGQWGVIARRQALATGVTARQIHGCLASGEWRIELPALYAFTDFPRSWWQRAKAAELWAGQGGALSGASAAFVWAFEGFSPGSIELSTNRDLRSEELLVRRVRSWMEGEIVTHRGLRITGVERTIADLSATIDPPALEALVDEALRRSCTTERNLDDYLAGFNGRGPHGVARLRQVLSERVAGAAPESRLETMLARLFRTSSLPTPARQHPIVHEGRFVARVDFAWPAYRVAVEAQSRTHHADKTSFERDLARMNALTQALWTVLYITWDDGRRRPRETLDLVARTLHRAGLR